ncbi:MAG TPA: histidine kinase dimerization/phospho-acceptor domain-containing protein, partial [Burkholderiales bacterium]
MWADEHAERALSVRALLPESLELALVGDAETALALARKETPAVACVAASLFTQDGVPLLRALRGLPNLHATALVLTCPRGEESSLSEELLACADDLLLTPLSAAELTARLRTHVRRARGEDAADLAFLSGIGHELRTPLTAILLWATSLRRGAKSGPELERALRCIAASAQGQSRKIDDLLDLSRLAEGRLKLDRRNTDISGLLRSAWDEIWPLAAAKHVALELDLAEPLGEADVDAGRIHQVLANLLSNAVKFTNAGGTVRLRARGHQQAIELEVSDTGEGIASELLPRLFERFQRR